MVVIDTVGSRFEANLLTIEAIEDLKPNTTLSPTRESKGVRTSFLRVLCDVTFTTLLQASSWKRNAEYSTHAVTTDAIASTRPFTKYERMKC